MVARVLALSLLLLLLLLFLSVALEAYGAVDGGARVERKPAAVTAAVVDCCAPPVLTSRPVRTPFAGAPSLSATCHKQKQKNNKKKNQLVCCFLSIFIP